MNSNSFNPNPDLLLKRPLQWKKPWLIQRIESRRPITSERLGVDVYFKFDYMGSAEFEFGALPAALREFRALNPEPILKRMKHNKHVAWFVGPSEFLGPVTEFFKAALAGEQQNLKEALYLRHAYLIDTTFRPETIGWWSIGQELPFAFFMKKADAETWLGAILTKKS